MDCKKLKRTVCVVVTYMVTLNPTSNIAVAVGPLVMIPTVGDAVGEVTADTVIGIEFVFSTPPKNRRVREPAMLVACEGASQRTLCVFLNRRIYPCIWF